MSDYMKTKVYAQRELRLGVLSAARCINNATLFYKVTHSEVTKVRIVA
jgi:hypothetical protein